MIKSFLASTIAQFGYEMCRLSPLEIKDLPKEVWMNYKEAQVYRGLTASGQISLVEALFLMKLVRDSDESRPLIEVGTLYGHSTLVMCLAKPPSQKLLAVDNFSWNSLGISSPVHLAATWHRLAECVEDYGVEIVARSAKDFYDGYKGAPPALYFCDADHRYEAVRDDIAWARKVGATIFCGDDYAPEHMGVTRAVDEAGGPSELHGGLWLL
ncbi:MAG: class I SAM-dependent methyltransferase [Rhizobacter sp.]|nr:class I SAM-dependent methyltransferase [Rhizobacter sp.]